MGSRDLTAQQVEVLRGSRRLRDADVVARRQRKETFESTARVFRVLDPRSRGQQHDETRELAPLVFGGDEEVVDNDFRAVHEVAELRLPRDEGVLCFTE